jgi:hypothetical protein
MMYTLSLADTATESPVRHRILIMANLGPSQTTAHHNRKLRGGKLAEPAPHNNAGMLELLRPLENQTWKHSTERRQ